MDREKIYNFSAGPSMLPLEVLERAQAEMISYGNIQYKLGEVVFPYAQ